MVRIAASKARQDLSEILNRAAYQGERIVLNRNGKDVAAIVSVDDLRKLEALEDQLDYEAGQKALEKMKAKRHRPIPWQRVKRSLKLK